MKLIDEKGRLFGLVNVLDLLFVLILAVAIVGGAKRLKGTRVVNDTSRRASVEFLVKEVRQVTVDNIKVGDEVYHYDKGTYFGKITKTWVEPYTEKVESGDGAWVMAQVPERYNVHIIIEGDMQESDQAYTFGGEQLKIGNEYRLKTKTSAFFGTCFGFDEPTEK